MQSAVEASYYSRLENVRFKKNEKSKQNSIF